MSSNTTPEIIKQDDVTIIVFGPGYENLDTETVHRLTGIVDEVGQTADPPLLLYDLSATTYFGSDFISVLLRSGQEGRMDPKVSDWLNLVFRWIHVIAGVMWIGHLWFFNFVNSQVAKTFDADSKRKVVPELMPRALYGDGFGQPSESDK